jgi:hypothetical protein
MEQRLTLHQLEESRAQWIMLREYKGIEEQDVGIVVEEQDFDNAVKEQDFDNAVKEQGFDNAT